MANEIPSYLLEDFTKLPLAIQVLKEKYPTYIANVAEYYFEPPLEASYKPTIIEIFHDDATEPDITIVGNNLNIFEPGEANIDHPVTAIRVDGHWVYIEIEGEEILDRRGEFVLPEIRAEQSQSALLKAAAKSISSVLDFWQGS